MEKKLQQRKVYDSDIARSLKWYNAEVHGRGETLPEQQQVFRVKVVKYFKLMCHYVNLTFSMIFLKRQAIYRPTDRRFLFDLIPFILEEKKAHIKQSLHGQFLSISSLMVPFMVERHLLF